MPSSFTRPRAFVKRLAEQEALEHENVFDPEKDDASAQDDSNALKTTAHMSDEDPSSYSTNSDDNSDEEVADSSHHHVAVDNLQDSSHNVNELDEHVA